MRKLGIIGLIFSMIFNSCVKELEYPNNQSLESNVALHAFLNPDSIDVIQLSKVVNITEDIVGIDNANIELLNLSSGDKTIMVHKTDGAYNGNITIAQNDVLSLTVNWNNIQYTAQTYVPVKPIIDTVSSKLNFVGSIGFTRVFNFTLKDIAASTDYYRLYLITQKVVYTLDANSEVIDSSIVWEKSSISGDEIGFIRNSYNNYTTKELLFSDESFNGLTTSLEFYLTKPENETNSKLIQHRIVVENLPIELFDYYNSRNAHLWQQSSITQSPTPLRGNIPNMYGVFAAYNLTDYILSY